MAINRGDRFPVDRSLRQLLQGFCVCDAERGNDQVELSLKVRRGAPGLTNYCRIPRPLTNNRAQPKYNAIVAITINAIATLIRMSDTPRIP
jgi:hypothetical protein